MKRRGFLCKLSARLWSQTLAFSSSTSRTALSEWVCLSRTDSGRRSLALLPRRSLASWIQRGPLGGTCDSSSGRSLRAAWGVRGDGEGLRGLASSVRSLQGFDTAVGSSEAGVSGDAFYSEFGRGGEDKNAVVDEVLLELDRARNSADSHAFGDLVERVSGSLRSLQGSIGVHQVNQVLRRLQTHDLLLAFYEWANGGVPAKCDRVSYQIVVTSLGRMKKFEEMEAFVDKMKLVGIHPDVITYTDIINVYGNADDFEKAVEKYKRMRSEGIFPNAVTYSILIGLLTKNGNYDDAVQLYKELRTAHIDLNSTLCTTLISLFGKMRRFEDIHSIFQTMKSSPNCYPSVHTYSLLIDLHLKAKHYEDVLALIKEMKARKIMPTNVTFNTLLVVYDKLGLVSEISKLKNEMKLFNIEPDVIWHNTIMKFHIRDSKFQLVENEFLNMKSSGINPDAVSYNILIHSYIARNLFSKAASVLDEMKDEEIPPTLSTYVLIFQFWVDCNCLSHKKELWKLLSKTNFPFHNSLDELVSDQTLADEVYDNVIDSLIKNVSISNTHYRRGLLNSLIEYLNKSNRQKICFLLWSKLRETNFFPNLVVEIPPKWSIDFHGFSSFTAEIILRYELHALYNRTMQGGERAFPEQISIITGKSYGFSIKSVKNGVILVLRIMDFPFGKETSHGGVMHAEGNKVKDWLSRSSITASLLADKTSFISSNLNLIDSLDFSGRKVYHKNNVDWLRKHKILSKRK